MSPKPSSVASETQPLTRQQTKPHEATIPSMQVQDRDVEGVAVRRSQQHCRGSRLLQLYRRIYLATRGRYPVDVCSYVDSSVRYDTLAIEPSLTHPHADVKIMTTHMHTVVSKACGRSADFLGR